MTDWLRTQEAAYHLNMSPRTLEKMRYLGTGPTYRKPGGMRVVLYSRDDLDDWVRSEESLRVDRRGLRDRITEEWREVHGQRVLVKVCPPARAGARWRSKEPEARNWPIDDFRNVYISTRRDGRTVHVAPCVGDAPPSHKHRPGEASS